MEQDWNWGMIFVRALAPLSVAAIMLLVVGTAFASLVGRVALDLAGGVALLLLLGNIIAMFLQLRRWERGRVNCPKCDGPIGWWPHMGRKYYGKQLPDFHRCWNCGKAVPVDQ